jgi:triacylglycerol esterase/lipase EstA (alpha/beta hydrolase family)
MPDYGLAPVVQPEDSKVDVDVIFVHGLNGGRTRTWTADRERCPEDTPFWPQWLKNDIPSARVWTYGYNSSAFADVSADNVDIHAETFLKALVDSGVGKRKGDGLSNIVFVGHSLGGIIIKLVIPALLRNRNMH